MINLDSTKKYDIERLINEQKQYLSECENKINQWEKFKQDYIYLKERLTKLPDELNYEIMVPYGRLAFMPGKLVKTNEVLVLLGDNWFVERSTKQSCDIIDRRLNGIEHHLTNLKKEIKMFDDRYKYTSDVMKENKEYVNIEEKLDENEYVLSSKKNKKKELNEEEKKKQRLLLQNKAQQVQMKINERIKNAQKEFNQDKEDEEEEQLERKQEISENFEKNIELIKIDEKRKSVHWSDTDIDQKKELNIQSHDLHDENYNDDNENESESTEDSIYDLYDNKSNVIYIKHTPIDEEIFKISNIEYENEFVIKTPGDIYPLFHKPKSILKNQSSFENELLKPFENNIEKNTKPIFDSKKAFSGEIVEHDENLFKKIIQSESQVPKKISKFKASKQQK